MKTKKYRGKGLCEATIDVDRSSGSPKVVRCGNKAEFLFFWNDQPHCAGALVCGDCCEKLKQQFENCS